MTIRIEPDLEARLREIAEQSGGDVQALANLLIADALRNDRVDADMTEEEKERMHQGIMRGLADEAAGRVKPLSQVIAEARQKHGFPESWPFGEAK